MICNTCLNDAVSNEAMGKTFWYCRTCKVEVLGRKASQEKLSFEGLDLGDLSEEEQKEFDDWLNSIATNSDDGPVIDYYDDDIMDGCD